MASGVLCVSAAGSVVALCEQPAKRTAAEATAMSVRFCIWCYSYPKLQLLLRFIPCATRIILCSKFAQTRAGRTPYGLARNKAHVTVILGRIRY